MKLSQHIQEAHERFEKHSYDDYDGDETAIHSAYIDKIFGFLKTLAETLEDKHDGDLP